jgi:hypothetical protein
MKILYFFLFLWVIFALLDPDPATQINADPCGSGYGSGSETLDRMEALLSGTNSIRPRMTGRKHYYPQQTELDCDRQVKSIPIRNLQRLSLNTGLCHEILAILILCAGSGAVIFGPPGSLIICTDPAPDPSTNRQKIKKNLDFPVLRV